MAPLQHRRAMRKMAGRTFHRLPAASRPVAAFSPAVEADGRVVLTGQMPSDPAAPDAPPPDGIAAQTRRVMRILAQVLDARGIGLEHVLRRRRASAPLDRD